MSTQTISRSISRALRQHAVPSSQSRYPSMSTRASAVTHSLRRVFYRVLRMPGAPTEDLHPAVKQKLDELAANDSWFYDHFVKAPRIVADFLHRVIALDRSVVLDFGCGQGLMAK